MGKDKYKSALKKGKLPKAFHDDGLADILEWIDDEILKPKESELRLRKKRPLALHTRETKEKKRSIEETFDGDDDDDSVVDTDDIKTETKRRKTKPQLAEDIYGNVLDEHGNIVEQNVAIGKLDADSDMIEVDESLQRKVRGLINRLTSQTISYVSSEIEKLYKTHQRLMINEAIFRVIDTSGIHLNNLAPRKLVAELMLLVSYLSHRIGNELGSGFVHRLVVKFEKLIKIIKIDDESKSIDNVVACLVNLYIINLIGVQFIFEIVQQLCVHFSEKSIELILFILKTVGFQLRKDDPSRMRQFIMTTQEKCSDLGSVTGGTRVEFMIDALAAIKNNNITKLHNYGCNIDRDTIESTMKNLIKRAHLPESLEPGTYEEVLASSKWHVLETQVYHPPTSEKQVKISLKQPVLSESEPSTDAKLCKALGLNTPIRKTIFNALINASDYIEATNSIIGCGVKCASDAMTVCLHMAIHERVYNPFYFHLFNNLCKFDRKYKMATKFAVQDKIRELSSSVGSSKTRVAVFARLTFELVKEDAIPITILKAVEWADIGSAHSEYLNILLGSIMKQPEKSVKKVFSKVDKKETFASALRMFIACFLKEDGKSLNLPV